MKQIKLTYAKGTGFDPFFDQIRNITVDDAPFAGGGFGDIYHARSFNGGQQPPLKQVIKVFKPSTIGKDEHSWNTIVRLQEKLMEKMELCADSGQAFLEQYPALIAMPQFVFEGTMDGRKVRGYATNNLNDLGFVSFDKVVDEEGSPYIEEFENKDMIWRFIMAYHLVRGFNLLYEIHFLHADISSDNIFVSLTQPTCAILDFDSGSIVETMQDNPSTFGKFQPWLAPEISFQLKKGQESGGNMLVSINSFTDAWSVANALLNVLLLMPAFYLVDMSENSLKAYGIRYTWPAADFSDPLFDPDNEEAYEYFKSVFDQLLPDEVKREFVATFSKGVFKPNLRTSYSRWERIFRSLIPKSEWKTGGGISSGGTGGFSGGNSGGKTGGGSYGGGIGTGGSSGGSYGKPGGGIGTGGSSSYGGSGGGTSISPPPPGTGGSGNGLQAKKELENYINALVQDVVNGDENLDHHKFFINDMAKKAGLNGNSIMKELKDFVDLYKECIADKVITQFEKSNLLMQAEEALVSEETVMKLIKPFKMR